MILVVITTLLCAVGTSGLIHQVFAQPSEKPDPCKVFKELSKYVEQAGLLAVATGDEDKMSNLVDDFRHYANVDT